MIDIVLVMFFQAATATGPAQVQEQDSSSTVTVTAEAPKEEKQTCRYVLETGSRVKRQKVCNVDESASNNEQQSKLMRQLEKSSNIAPPPAVFGN